MVRKAREGGSINPAAAQALKRLREQGKLSIMEKTKVVEVKWDEEMSTWNIRLDSNQTLECVDQIWLATGR